MTNIYKHWKNGKHRKKIAHYFFVFVHNSFWNYFFVMIKKHICTTNCIFSVKWKPEKNLEKKLQQRKREKNSLKRHRYTKERKPLNCLHVALITQKDYKNFELVLNSSQVLVKMGSRSENNSPNHENSNKTGDENRGVLRRRKATLHRRNSAPNLKYLSQTSTTSTGSRTRSVIRFCIVYFQTVNYQ